MQFSDNEIIALLFGTSLSEPKGMFVFLQLVTAVKRANSLIHSTKAVDAAALGSNSRSPNLRSL